LASQGSLSKILSAVVEGVVISACHTDVGVTKAILVALIQVQKSIYSASSICLSFFLAFKSKIYQIVRFVER